jgi:hypothetical protein
MTVPPALQTVLSWFGGGVAVIVGLTGVAYWLFKTFAAKWLDNRFSTRLEAYKHELSRMLDRATRLHAQEFEILPTLWEKLVTAMDNALSVMSPLQLSNDFNHASAAELEVILEKSPLLEHEKQQVRDAKMFDRTSVFDRIQRHYRLQGATNDWRDFHSYALTKSIFIDPDLSAKIQELIGLISKAFEANYWSKFDPHDAELRKEVRAAHQTLMDDGSKLRGEIETAVSARLRAAASGS